jgi:hypothetical protein
MYRRHFRWLTVSALVVLVCFGGCGQGQTPVQSPVITTGPEYTRLHVLRTSAFPANHIPPFEVTVGYPPKIRQFYAAIQALPAFPSGTINCPADSGVVYQLTFSGPGMDTAHVNIQATGCQGVSFDGAHGWTKWVATAPGFWQQFADTLGVPEAMVYPVSPQSGGPSAPTAVP